MGLDTAAAPPPLRPWSHAVRLVAAAAFGAWVWVVTVGALPVAPSGPAVHWLLFVDPLVAVACLVLVVWRRRRPLGVAVAVTTLSAASVAAGGAALLALASLATRRDPARTGAVAVAFVLTALPTLALYPRREPADGFRYQLSIVVLAAAVAVAAGTAVGARRDELRTLRRRAELAEREQAARAAEARMGERQQIAREMHDVLAHRVSLVAMQAAALGHRPDLPAEQVTELASSIAGGARQALEELRDVLGVLRSSDVDPDAEERVPLPSLADLAALVDDTRASGVDVTLACDVDPASPAAPPVAVQRTVYRLVQEGLTNAVKHAPGARVQITVDGDPGSALRVSVHDDGAAADAPRPAESGFGLSGLAERVALAGGRLTHGHDPGGGYRLSATLPWPAADPTRTS